MNKTLLLILCDFLLLTILSMWKMEDDAPVTPAGETSNEVSVSSMAVMEQDLLDTLQFALDEEKDERSDLAENLNQQAEELAQTQSELENRDARIENLQEEMSAAELRELALKTDREKLELQSATLANEVQQSATNYAVVENQLRESELAAKQSAAQSRLLQEELDQKLEDIANKEAALSTASQQLEAAEGQVQELNVQVRMSAQQNEFLQESVTSLKGEVAAERVERAKIQEQAGKLAEGVSQLAENSQDLREELRSNIPVNANQLFSAYKENRVTANFSSLKYQRPRYVEMQDTISTVLVTDGTDTYALYHVDSGPFGLKSNTGLIRSIQLSLSRFGNNVNLSQLKFLALDPRVLAILVTEEQVAGIGAKVYLTALDPYKWEEAVLVNLQGDKYGEVDFKLDADAPGFVKMQTKIFSSIFGDFSPSTGDLVLSKTGELLGIMVNRRYCVVIDNFLSAGSIELGDTLNADAFQRTLNEQANLLDTFPTALR